MFNTHRRVGSCRVSRCLEAANPMRSPWNGGPYRAHTCQLSFVPHAAEARLAKATPKGRSMSNAATLRRMFDLMDRKQAAAVRDLLAPGCTAVMGGNPPMDV